MTTHPSAPAARTDRYVVAGRPVEHSQSPFIHAEFARRTGEAVEYGRLLCPADGFDAAVRALAASGARGCNVTMPFKVDAARLATRLTPRAALAGAANVLAFGTAGAGADWLGENTDGIGLVTDIERNAGVALAGRRVLLIGAGGGAAGALGALLAAGPAEVVVANRDPAKAEALVARHRDAGFAAALVRAAALDACGRAYDVVVNATSSSLQGAPVPVAAEVVTAGTLAVDMMYGAPAAGFVAWAEAHGGRGRDGLGMLVEQAAEAFLLWRGIRPETAPVLAALRRRLAAAA